MVTLKFHETFNYLTFPNGRCSPIIQVRFEIQSISFQYPMLVDSGADLTVLPMKITLKSPISLLASTDIDMKGLGESKGRRLENVKITLGRKELSCPVVFTKSINSLNYGLLGRECVFPELKIAFQENAKKIYISYQS